MVRCRNASELHSFRVQTNTCRHSQKLFSNITDYCNLLTFDLYRPIKSLFQNNCCNNFRSDQLPDSRVFQASNCCLLSSPGTVIKPVNPTSPCCLHSFSRSSIQSQHDVHFPQPSFDFSPQNQIPVPLLPLCSPCPLQRKRCSSCHPNQRSNSPP